MGKQKQTTVINIFAGPSAGKTGCAWIIGGELKKRSQSVEYVSEYAKELVWDENYELLKNQKHVHAEQTKRIKRLLGKVSYIVTDSPVLLGIIYGRENGVDIERDAVDFHNSTQSLNLFLERNEQTFENEGRVHDLKQSKQIDRQIKRLLSEFGVEYQVVNHENVINIIKQKLSIFD